MGNNSPEVLNYHSLGCWALLPLLSSSDPSSGSGKGRLVYWDLNRLLGLLLPATLLHLHRPAGFNIKTPPLVAWTQAPGAVTHPIVFSSGAPAYRGC